MPTSLPETIEKIACEPSVVAVQNRALFEFSKPDGETWIVQAFSGSPASHSPLAVGGMSALRRRYSVPAPAPASPNGIVQ